jgi:hypothetical protein
LVWKAAAAAFRSRKALAPELRSTIVRRECVPGERTEEEGEN